jgi:hypothetical protein
MKTINDATFDDLVYIGSWLCDADRAELAATRDPDDYVALARDAWRSPIKKVVLDNALPVFAFGANPTGTESDLATVWGFKTRQGVRAIRQVTKYIRKIMIPELRAMGIRHAACLVHADNNASKKWLSHLGFRPKATLREFGTHNEEMILFQRDEPDAHPS